jgi:hypothetical protein
LFFVKETLTPQGPTFVRTGSVTPEVPELPSAYGYNWATRSQGDINSGDWPSRLEVGRKARDLTLENIACYEISDKNRQVDLSKNWKELAIDRKAWNDLSEKVKTHKGS